MLIRNATAGDIDALLEIEKNSFDCYWLKKENFLHLIKKGNCDFIVLIADKIVAGYALALYKKNSNKAYLYSIAVESRYRKKSFGKNLLAEIEHRARQKKCTSIHLEVKVSASGVISFYKKSGYKEIRFIRNYYGPFGDAVVYHKSIHSETCD